MAAVDGMDQRVEVTGRVPPRSAWLDILRRSRLLALSLLALSAAPRDVAAEALSVERGKQEFVFTDERGDPRRDKITVFSYVPEKIDLRQAPILFAMHGHHRSSKGYRNDWAQYADKHGFMVFAPLFDEKHWGKGRYSYASVVSRKGKIRDPSRWSFSVIERLFDAIKASTGNTQPRYLIFGFSEGGQFVHRMVLMMPQARFSRAVAGSPGWYTMPRMDVKFPYGLAGSPASPASLKTSLGRDFVLLLGEADNDPNHEELRKTPEAMAQGENRLARGKRFFAEGQRRAREMGTPFGWRTQNVPGADHTSRKVTGQAAAIFMDR